MIQWKESENFDKQELKGFMTELASQAKTLQGGNIANLKVHWNNLESEDFALNRTQSRGIQSTNALPTRGVIRRNIITIISGKKRKHD